MGKTVEIAKSEIIRLGLASILSTLAEVSKIDELLHFEKIT